MTERTKALIVIGIFTFMSTLDGSIINIALPTMSRELHTSTVEITWGVTIYLIVISAIILIFGRLSDLIGKAKVIKIGWAIFILGSFLAGFNFGFGLSFLLFARIIQAIGASMMMVTSFGMVSQIFPAESRAKALSVVSMFVSAGSIVGHAVGGVILQVVSWNYIFWINVPIGIAAWIFGNRPLPTTNGHGKLSDMDLKGGSLMTAVIVLLFLALNFGMTLGFTSPLILSAVVLWLVLFVLFIRTEQKSPAPLLGLRFFQIKIIFT